ncbi:hypothetical protein L596_000859 [Steinernema carpocapsae]|uniref:Mediator complex subunit 8 n=1 Tax=Steinernema carpocapsae TaxID=34508 RepID=A0A4V6I785_STECR|nr:hypothetical protein L596_000859 [Steinernema carpocapsae]
MNSNNSLTTQRLNGVIGGLEMKLADLRTTIEGVLVNFDQQDNASWPEILEKFKSATHDFAAIQRMMTRRSVFLGGQALVPRNIRPDVDLALAYCIQLFKRTRATLRLSRLFHKQYVSP